MAAASTDGASINIMPMLDIFSILMTFLLMNFSAEPANYESTQGTALPESRITTSLDGIPSVVITRNQILVRNRVIAKIKNGKVEKKLLRQGAIFPLFKVLKKMSEANKRMRKRRKAEVEYLTLEVDKMHRFKLLKRVMISAQQAGFIAFKIMVNKI